MTINVNPEFLLKAYLVVHVLFALVTHYHSVIEVREYNREACDQDRVNPLDMLLVFVGRLAIAFPWFIIRLIVAPVGSPWHWTPKQIATYL